MRVRAAHASMQFKDSTSKQVADQMRFFDLAVQRRYAWITGTEAGPGAGRQGQNLIEIGADHGYRLWVPSVEGVDKEARSTDAWIAVREDIIGGNWKQEFDFVIPSSKDLDEEMNLPRGKRWGPKGVVSVAFDCALPLGRINIGASHYLTDAHNPKSDYWEWNQKLADAFGKWARRVGKGKNLAFYGGDQNMHDARNRDPQGDTFMGNPLTSMADELRDWQDTIPGRPIDVMASYNADSRVRAVAWNVLNDREFRLNMDHYFCEGLYNIEPLAKHS